MNQPRTEAERRKATYERVNKTERNSTGVFIDEHFDWHADRPLSHPWSKTVIYEMHVRGFTIHSDSGVEHLGTYRGLTEKIPYLKELGVTSRS